MRERIKAVSFVQRAGAACPGNVVPVRPAPGSDPLSSRGRRVEHPGLLPLFHPFELRRETAMPRSVLPGRPSLLASLLCLALPAAPARLHGTETVRPNVIVILADDM